MILAFNGFSFPVVLDDRKIISTFDMLGNVSHLSWALHYGEEEKVFNMFCNHPVLNFINQCRNKELVIHAFLFALFPRPSSSALFRLKYCGGAKCSMKTKGVCISQRNYSTPKMWIYFSATSVLASRDEQLFCLAHLMVQTRLIIVVDELWFVLSHRRRNLWELFGQNNVAHVAAFDMKMIAP